MIKNELVIDCDELHSNKIIKDTEFVFIVKGENINKYRVIDTEQKLLDYSYNNNYYTENKAGILVTVECNNISGTFNNAIFLEKFKIDSYSDPKLDNSIYLNFNNCEF